MPAGRTMQQIADDLGLSRLTVSSVVNGKAEERGISPATAQRVREHLQRVGYVPSRSAVDLRRGRRRSVGLLYTGQLYSHLTEAFNRFVDHVNSSAGTLEIMVTPPSELDRGIRELIARGVDRLVWVYVQHMPDEPALMAEVRDYLRSFETAIVYNAPLSGGWHELLREAGAHLVGVDRVDGFRRLGRFLRRIGHRQVIVPEADADAVPDHPPSHPLSFRGLAAAGLTPFGSRPVTQRGVQRPGRGMANAIIRSAQKHDASAVCFYDDQVAGLAMPHLQEAGIALPDDLTVTGYDGMDFSAALRVPLTTLRVPVARMVDLVIELLTDAPGEHLHRFDLELVKRASHAAPAREDIRKVTS